VAAIYNSLIISSLSDRDTKQLGVRNSLIINDLRGRTQKASVAT